MLRAGADGNLPVRRCRKVQLHGYAFIVLVDGAIHGVIVEDGRYVLTQFDTSGES
jgi:hypothetical protein